MKLDGYSHRELYLSAIKAEAEAARVYSRLAGMVRNAYLRHTLRFLASEEESHRRDLTRIYRRESGKRSVWLPLETPVPMPFICEPGPDVLPGDVIESAMDAERAAQRFYQNLSRRYPVGSNEAFLLVYLSSMEKGHYQLLQNERALLEQAERFETQPL